MIKTHKVLWTGGWDSTYRILDLILNKNVIVYPYYVLDNGRKSTKMELSTMDKIKKDIADIDDKKAENLMETQIVNMSDIPINEEITKYYNILANQSHLGSQYDWLARYCEHYNIYDLELCIHADDTVEGFIKNDVRLINEENDRYYKLVKNPSQKPLKVFSFYDYPLFDMSKLDMESNAKEFGFDHIMEITWFCHSPLNNKPCGMCNPCKYTRDEGLGRRVPNPNLMMRFQRKTEKLLKRIKAKLS